MTGYENCHLCPRNCGIDRTRNPGPCGGGSLPRLARAALPLAVFAAQITGNPHFFDRGTPPGDMLTQAMASLQGVEAPQDAYRWREWMQSIGIVPDTVSSLVHVYGIVLHTPQETHPAFRAFCERHESYVVTLEALAPHFSPLDVRKQIF